MSNPSELVDVEFRIRVKARSRGRYAESLCESLFNSFVVSLKALRPSWKVSFEKEVKK